MVSNRVMVKFSLSIRELPFIRYRLHTASRAGVKCEVRVCEVVKCEVRCEVGCGWSVASGSPRTLPNGN